MWTPSWASNGPLSCALSALLITTSSSCYWTKGPTQASAKVRPAWITTPANSSHQRDLHKGACGRQHGTVHQERKLTAQTKYMPMHSDRHGLDVMTAANVEYVSHHELKKNMIALVVRSVFVLFHIYTKSLRTKCLKH